MSRQKYLALVAVIFVLSGLGVSSYLVSQIPSTSTPDASLDGASDLNGEKNVGADTASVSATVPAGQFGIPEKTQSDPRMSFLLLGYGGAGHDGSYLSDSMMLAVADPNQKTLTLLSIPRDSWVPMLFDGKTAVYNKLNTGFAFAKDASLYRNRLARYSGDHGAGNFAADTTARILGLPISNYLGLDFDGFRQMIDAVGGIDVNIPSSFAAQYPANDDSNIDSSWMVVRFKKGIEHMNGERAIEYARARETIDSVSEGSDFARSRRQRLIMEAFKTRLLEAGGMIHLPQILSIAARHVDTDYPLTAAGQLSQFLLGWKDVRVYQTAITGANYMIDGVGPDGAYVLIPNSSDHSWAQIRAFARRLWQDPATGVAIADTRVIIVNNTGQSGAAGRLTTALEKLGYHVGSPVSGVEKAESRLVDRTDGKAKLVAAQLEKDLGLDLPVVSDASAGDSSDLVLELGANDIKIADLSVPADNAAPSSVTGIVKFDGWVPVIAPPAPEETATSTPAPAASPHSSPKPGGSPTGVAKGTPQRGTATPVATTTAARTPVPATATPIKAATPTTRPSASP